MEKFSSGKIFGWPGLHIHTNKVKLKDVLAFEVSPKTSKSLPYKSIQYSPQFFVEDFSPSSCIKSNSIE